MKKIFTMLCLALCICGMAQVKIGGRGLPDSLAVLELDGSNGKGLLLPRVTKAQREAMTNIPPGLMVYQTDGLTADAPRGLYYCLATSLSTYTWVQVSNGKNFWSAHYLNPSHIISDNTGNVGIGTGFYGFEPAMKLDVQSSNGNVAVFSNSQQLATDVSAGIYLRMGQLPPKYTGAIKTIGMSSTDARLGMFTGTSTNADNLTERLSISNTGNVGIGNSNPQAALSFAASLGKKISLYRGTTGDAGFGVYGNELRINSDYNGADITFGYDNLTNGFTERMRIKGNGKVGIGTDDPDSRLHVKDNSNTFSASFTQSGNGPGLFAYAANNFAMYAGNNGTEPTAYIINASSGGTALITSGKVGINTGSNPAFPLDVNGRMRIRHDNETAGIWFNKSTNATGSFIGQFDDNNFGIYGAGSWKFLFDVTDNTMRIGTTQKASGYMLNVGGKVIAEEVRVQLKGAWPDYVFNKNYKLRSLNDVADYITINNHLPNVPAAADVERSGIALGEMQTKMMEKIEELTLYVIELENKINRLTKKKK